MIMAGGPSTPASQVPSVSATRAVLVGERVLAEVPDRSVVGLGVVVDGDLEDAPVEIGNELGFARLYVLPVPADGSRSRGAGWFSARHRSPSSLPIRTTERRLLIGKSGL